MFTVKPPTSRKPEISGNLLSAISIAGKYGTTLKIVARATESRMIRRCGSVRAVISSEDKAMEASALSENKNVNGSLISSSSSKGILVKAVVSIRKKMKEKIIEKIEDQFEYFVNGIGQGIQIQLISEEIDPG